MLLKSKEELYGAARIILNNLDELLMELNDRVEEVSAQEVLESDDWIHVYNLIQRVAFINNRDPHFGVLGELERLAEQGVEENNFDLRYTITQDGIILHYVSPAGLYIHTIEVWCLDRAIEGLKLNMPSGK